MGKLICVFVVCTYCKRLNINGFKISRLMKMKCCRRLNLAFMIYSTVPKVSHVSLWEFGKFIFAHTRKLIALHLFARLKKNSFRKLILYSNKNIFGVNFC